jgi:SAM-dependent methyltransferase
LKQATKEIVYEYIPKYLKGKALDVGAGNQKYKGFIGKYCDQYMTLDIQGDVDFKADAKNMPIENSTFDSVLSFQMFEHVDEPQRIVSECIEY